MPPPPLAPPPPPSCFPFSSSKPKCCLSWSSADSHPLLPILSKEQKMVRHPSFSVTSTFNSRLESITFHSDLEKYDVSTLDASPALQGDPQAWTFQHDTWNEKVDHFFQVGLCLGSWEEGQGEQEGGINGREVWTPTQLSTTRVQSRKR